MTLQIYNVLGRTKQEFIPIHERRVGMYVCGPTVQDYAHLGHAKTYIAFDVVARYLRYSGYDLLYVQNLTDVGHLLDSGEDRVLKKARQLQSKPMQIVEYYTRAYFDDMDALGIQRPDISPRASGHIPEQIQMIETLIAKEHAYVVGGNVYFDVTSDPDYGRLSNRKLDEQESGTREAVRDDKHNPEDFALWKAAGDDHILQWDSPWGAGYPGWHIECSAMAKKYLGETFDIHGGGVDNIYPHNENEITQSECANEQTYANYWMLTGSLTLDGVKMSKSLGNFVRIRDARDAYRPEILRMNSLMSHYRNPVDYSERAMQDAAGGWERLMNAVRLNRHQLQTASSGDDGNAFLGEIEQVKTDFVSVMDDDFSTPKAIAILQEFTRKVNSLLNNDATVSTAVLEAIDSAYNELGGDVLGIIPIEEVQVAGNSEREAKLIEMLITMRNEARANKDWATSDTIRDRLADAGVILEDRSDGTIWKVD